MYNIIARMRVSVHRVLYFIVVIINIILLSLRFTAAAFQSSDQLHAMVLRVYPANRRQVMRR